MTSDPSPPPRELAWWALTHPGRFRKNNEDAFLALTLDRHGHQFLGKNGRLAMDRNDLLFAVSDGMGGAKSGEFASRIAVEKITDLLPRNFQLQASGITIHHADILEELFDRIHEDMTRMAFHYEECRGMGATLSLCWFTPDWLHFAHAGDSRIYYLPREGDIRQLTEDHTQAASLLRKGLISEREARHHPESHVLYNVLGGKTRAVAPQVGAVGFNPGDRFILCSDGLTEGLREHRMQTLLRNPPERFAREIPSDRLLKDSMEESGKDNITVIVVEIPES